MEVTYKIANKGNLAIQTEVWYLPIEVARKLLKYLKKDEQIVPGRYWYWTAAKPIRKAIKGKSKIVTIYTAGFTTERMHSFLLDIDCTVKFDGLLQ